MKSRKIECPVYDITCPYCKDGYCIIEDPTECDDYCAEVDDDYDFMELGYDPYLGGYTYDC